MWVLVLGLETGSEALVTDTVDRERPDIDDSPTFQQSQDRKCAAATESYHLARPRRLTFHAVRYDY